MRKWWLVASNEYQRHVFSKGFIVVVLVLPLVLGFSLGLGLLIDRLENPTAAVGYVDQSGLLAVPVPAPQREGSPNSPSISALVPLIPYSSEEAADRALRAGDLQAYYVVSADYPSSRHVTLVYITPPGGNVTSQFWDFLQINSLVDLPPDISRRAVAGSNLIIRWPEDVPGGAREFSQRTFWTNIAPLFTTLPFIILLMVTSGAFIELVQREKENRTMEVVLSSLSAEKLIGGKLIGVLGVVATELAIWIGAGIVLLAVGRRLGITAVQNLVLDGGMLLRLAAVALPSYVLAVSLMAALGAVVAESQEAQSVSFLVAVPFIAPFWLAPLIIETTSNTLPVVFSLFPLTALTTISLRMMFDPIPDWQVFIAAGLTALAAVGGVWLATRAFRLGMLRYEQVRWRELFARLAK